MKEAKPVAEFRFRNWFYHHSDLGVTITMRGVG